MNNHTYTRKYTRACIQTHIQTEIMIILAFYTWFRGGALSFKNMPLAAMLNINIGRSRGGIC